MTRRNGTTPGFRKAARGTRFARLSDIAEPALRAASVQRGIAEHRLIEGWSSAVGPEIARLCRPVRLMGHGRGKDLGGTLVVAAPGPLIPELRHRADQVVERVNAVYGYRAVSRLRVEAETTHLAAAPVALHETSGGFLADAPPATISPSRAVRDIEDDGLRAALARLEVNIRRRAASDDPRSKP